MASTQFAFYGLMNPYTYQRPKITPLPNETGLTVPGGTGVAVVPNGTPPALKQPYLPGQYTEYPAAVQGWAQQALPGWGSGIESGTPSKVHGNSKLSTKPQHGYEIYNTETGDVVKTGISGQRMNLNGTSPRANIQVNRLNRGAGKNLYDSTIVATDMPNRLSALEWERENALRLWNEGNSMSLHRRPRPWED